MKIAFLVENWGEPWNEGYKNLAKYILEMLKEYVEIEVLSSNKISNSVIPLLTQHDLIHIFNYSIPLHRLISFTRIENPIIKHVAKKELDINVKSLIKTSINMRFVWDAFITTTEVLAKELRRLAKNKPIFHLPPPIPTHYFVKLDRDKSREVLGLKQDCIYIGYTGTLNKFRNLEVLLKAMKPVINDKADVKLLLALTNVSRKEFMLLKKLLLDYGFKPSQVVFVKTNDVRLIYSSLDALVYPAEREGSVEPPLTILEAMSSETIVVAYRNVITSRLIIDGFNGFLFSDSEDLNRISQCLISNRLNSEDIAKNARKTITKYYDFSNLRRSYIETYERIVSELMYD
jgi:glycosyltransferase involved in cell wall biosynthesis